MLSVSCLIALGPFFGFPARLAVSLIAFFARPPAHCSLERGLFILKPRHTQSSSRRRAPRNAM